MTQETLKKQEEKRQKSVKAPELSAWFKSYHATDLVFEVMRDEIARLPRKVKLRVLTQIDSLREDVAEMVKATF